MVAILVYALAMPSWVDPDSELWPPIAPSDLSNFGNPPRCVTYATWERADRVASEWERVYKLFPLQFCCADWCKACWDVLDDAAWFAGQGNWCMASTRLKSLRRLLGPIAYYGGQMPVVPVPPEW